MPYSKKGKLTKVCPVCSNTYKTPYNHQITCSKECKDVRCKKLYGRTGSYKIPTASTGAISEMQVCADLLSKGYSVFRAVSPACFCDVIAVKGDVVRRMEVRTGYRNTTTGNFGYPTNTHGTIDCFGVVLHDNKEVCYFDTYRKQISL